MDLAHETLPTPRGLTGAERAARRRLSYRTRKAAQRAQLRERGRLNREALDRALVDAFRELLSAHGDSLTQPVVPAVVLGIAMQRVVERAEQEARYLDQRALSADLGRRLLKPGRKAREGGTSSSH